MRAGAFDGAAVLERDSDIGALGLVDILKLRRSLCASIYVANLARLPAEDHAGRLPHAAFDAGHISQNVYLFCAAGMATVARARFDHAQLASLMGLGSGQRVTLAQTVGYPA
ncbi:hypothetical protein ASD15_09260 [Massilia sp. Root351]|nr:hypothetical protein ASD15_09260 [Massilia sp. Root351]